MSQILKLPLPIVCTAALLALGVLGCSGSPTEPSGEGYGPEGQGGESDESGTQYAISETATEVRGGVRLIISYNSARQVFTGSVENTTNVTVTRVRVEVHLLNGVELGPTPNVDLAPGETKPVELDARGQTFTHFSVHVEIGSSSA